MKRLKQDKAIEVQGGIDRQAIACNIRNPAKFGLSRKRVASCQTLLIMLYIHVMRGSGLDGENTWAGGAPKTTRTPT